MTKEIIISILVAIVLVLMIATIGFFVTAIVTREEVYLGFSLISGLMFIFLGLTIANGKQSNNSRQQNNSRKR